MFECKRSEHIMWAEVILRCLCVLVAEKMVTLCVSRGSIKTVAILLFSLSLIYFS